MVVVVRYSWMVRDSAFRSCCCAGGAESLSIVVPPLTFPSLRPVFFSTTLVPPLEDGLPPRTHTRKGRIVQHVVTTEDRHVDKQGVRMRTRFHRCEPLCGGSPPTACTSRRHTGGTRPRRRGTTHEKPHKLRAGGGGDPHGGASMLAGDGGPYFERGRACPFPPPSPTSHAPQGAPSSPPWPYAPPKLVDPGLFGSWGRVSRSRGRQSTRAVGTRGFGGEDPRVTCHIYALGVMSSIGMFYSKESRKQLMCETCASVRHDVLQVKISVPHNFRHFGLGGAR